jgi:hypothetical protein
VDTETVTRQVKPNQVGDGPLVLDDEHQPTAGAGMKGRARVAAHGLAHKQERAMPRIAIV